MTDHEHAAEQQGIQAAEEIRDVLAGLYPDATNVQVKTVNAYPDHFEILDYRADLLDGTSVHRSRIVIPR